MFGSTDEFQELERQNAVMRTALEQLMRLSLGLVQTKAGLRARAQWVADIAEQALEKTQEKTNATD